MEINQEMKMLEDQHNNGWVGVGGGGGGLTDVSNEENVLRRLINS
jgi:hypothetical protein